MKWNWNTGEDVEEQLGHCWFWYQRGLDSCQLRRIFLGVEFGKTADDLLGDVLP